MADSVDMKNMNNYKQFVDIVKIDPAWDPTNPLLAIVTMETQYTDCVTALNAITGVLAPQKININNRQEIFERFDPIVRRSRAVLKASGANQADIDDAETWARKILGTRAKPVPVDNPDTPANEAKTSISVSQQSYDALVGNMQGYRDMLSNIAPYKPNEADLKITALDALLNDANAATAAVLTGNVPVISARQTRDGKLYDNDDCAHRVFKMGKDYYKGVHGASSPQFKAVAGLSFIKR